MSHYKPYPAYKDSGVEWLGKVPKEWTIVSLSRLLATPVTDGPHETPEFLSEGIPFLSVDGIQEGELVFDGKRFISEQDHFRFSKKAKPRRDDILLGKAASVGKIARVKTDFEFNIWSPLALIRVNKSQASPTFVEYSLKSTWLQAQTETKANLNTQFNLGMKDISKLLFCVPPADEQLAITSHLDRETTRIDALITKKTRFIELLREKRQALITHAVTKGLDPNVKMKDSGVEWLGEVPEDWSVTHIKRLVSSISQGWSPECEARSPEEGEWGVLKVGCVNGGQFRVEESKALPNSLEPRPELAVREGDVLVSRANTRELVGSCAVVSRDFPKIMLCDKLYRLIAEPRKVLPEFLAALIAVHGRRIVEIEATGASSSMVNIAQSVIMDLAVAVPQVTEQRVIVTHLQSSAIKLDLVVTRTERSIELLKERRSALISAAVTGQIDLRDEGKTK